MCYTRMASFLKRYKYFQIGTPPPSGQSRHHRPLLVPPYPTSPLRGFSSSPTSHSDSFHFVILRAGPSSPKLLSYFRFGQTWSKTKTANPPGELLRPLTRSCFVLHLLGRVFLLALLILLGTCLPSLWSPPFPLHVPALVSSF